MTAVKTYWIETLGCPKNQVDSDKLSGRLAASGLSRATDAADADLVVVNTCAFVEEARGESVETILELDERRRGDSRLVVTGCMAERHGAELADALPEVDAVVGFGVDLLPGTSAQTVGPPGVPVSLGSRPSPAEGTVRDFDLLNLPRPASSAPWAYVKIAEGCDRACGFCAIPTFRGPQRSRSVASIVSEALELDVPELVLVAQDLAAFGRDQGQGERRINELVRTLSQHVPWVRLLYLYPSDLDERLIDTILSTGVAYFDLSLQHVSPPLMRRMRRFGDGERFLRKIEMIRRAEPAAALRSNFIIGYPGETESDHDRLLEFIREARLDWVGVFRYSAEEGTYAATLDDQVPAELVTDRLAEVSELVDTITLQRRMATIGEETTVLIDSPGRARSYREAPEIDGIIRVPDHLDVGTFQRVRIVGAGPSDLDAEPLGS